MNPEDRRRHPRVRLDLAARLELGERLLDARVRDICRDAVLLEANDWFPLGTELQVRVELPPPHLAIQASGRVLRLAPGEEGSHGMAVLFTEISTGDQLRIDFLTEPAARPSDD
jgi:hypothetical protein